MQLLGVCKTTACKLMKEWREELASKGYYGGQRGQISKSYVAEKLYGYKKDGSYEESVRICNSD
jgi:hypothetical protein